MTHIIIYTTGDVLLHKQGKLPDDEDYSEEGYYYWGLPRTPKKLKERERIYFAVKGYIRGYFKVVDIDSDEDGCDIEFLSESWRQLTCPVATKSFQGFKYADKVPELGASKVTTRKVK